MKKREEIVRSPDGLTPYRTYGESLEAEKLMFQPKEVKKLEPFPYLLTNKDITTIVLDNVKVIYAFNNNLKDIEELESVFQLVRKKNI